MQKYLFLLRFWSMDIKPVIFGVRPIFIGFAKPCQNLDFYWCFCNLHCAAAAITIVLKELSRTGGELLMSYPAWEESSWGAIPHGRRVINELSCRRGEFLRSYLAREEVTDELSRRGGEFLRSYPAREESYWWAILQGRRVLEKLSRTGGELLISYSAREESHC